MRVTVVHVLRTRLDRLDLTSWHQRMRLQTLALAARRSLPARTNRPRYAKMGKKKAVTTPESALLMPLHPAMQAVPPPPIVDTHCHMLSTYGFYRSKYPEGDKASVQDFVRSYMANDDSNKVEGLVDVYCEPPFTGWKECANLYEIR